MSEANLNPTIDGYRGSIGRLVFKRYKGRTIVSRKPVTTAEPSPAQLAQREHFKEAVAFGKFAQDDPELSAFYRPISLQRELSLYTVAMTDFLTKPSIKALNLSNYTGQAGETILISATDDIGLADVDVTIVSGQGSPIESGKALETGLGSGKWTYTATTSAAPGSDLLIKVTGVDHAGNEVIVNVSAQAAQGD